MLLNEPLDSYFPADSISAIFITPLHTVFVHSELECSFDVTIHSSTIFYSTLLQQQLQNKRIYNMYSIYSYLP
jgi:hypothetical protein